MLPVCTTKRDYLVAQQVRPGIHGCAHTHQAISAVGAHEEEACAQIARFEGHKLPTFVLVLEQQRAFLTSLRPAATFSHEHSFVRVWPRERAAKCGLGHELLIGARQFGKRRTQPTHRIRRPPGRGPDGPTADRPHKLCNGDSVRSYLPKCFNRTCAFAGRSTGHGQQHGNASNRYW